MKLRGVYTVEAAFIISFSLFVFGACVGVAYDVFENSIEYVSKEEEKFDAVEFFRGREAIGDIVDEFTEE